MWLADEKEVAGLKYAQIYMGDKKNQKYTTGMSLKSSSLQEFQVINHYCLLAKLTSSMQ